MKAKITYKPNGQKKKNLFSNLLKADVLKDICKLTTNQEEYEVIIDNSNKGVNIGRLVFVEYKGIKVTFLFQFMCSFC